ncbi:MAG: HAD family hydrolase [Verrucomicrobiota bacterium]
MNGTPLTPTQLSASVFLQGQPRAGITHVVFDFDGTLSWIRHGWPALMFETFRQHWPDSAETAQPQWHAAMEEIVFGMNGKPSLIQMQHYAQRALLRGGVELDPESLRASFQAALDREIDIRTEAIRTGLKQRDDFVIAGVRPLLEHLRSRGLTLAVLSSSVEHRVKEEAEVLGLTEFFGRHIYGSTPNPAGFSKMEVFRQILASEGITGAHLLSFGDGPVEIECTKQLGGLAVAVCSDEDENGSGVPHPYKLQQLIAVGADAAIPDYQEAIPLIDRIVLP